MAEDIPGALRQISMIAAIGTLVGSFELLSHLRRLLRAGFLGGQSDGTGKRSVGALLSFGPVICASLLLRIAASGAILWAEGPLTAVACLLVLISSVHLFLVNPYGQTAAEQFTVILFSGLTLAHAAQTNFGRSSALWFIALQCAICYAANGIHKLRSSVWRSGAAIRSVMATATFGGRRYAVVLARLPVLGCFVCWAVIAWEVLFPLSLLTPAAGVVFVSIGIAFHVATAVAMRLNNFLWAFPAAYPAVMYCGAQLHAWRG
jgi:hypothetical protein